MVPRQGILDSRARFPPVVPNGTLSPFAALQRGRPLVAVHLPRRTSELHALLIFRTTGLGHPIGAPGAGAAFFFSSDGDA